MNLGPFRVLLLILTFVFE